ncbi:ATP-binding protein [Desulfitobacterium dichloroeliminans]|uniref:ATP-binding protein n=1 Tax=Desulfitobacterium dichloroeliminans TaxID=233055 RepID=UPI00059E2666|nr:ATP-binding protein [Desulfitobacterium dichloroeliminans]
MFDLKVYDEIIRLINKRVEGDYWDYKQEWHSDNERLLLDILCFANTVHNKDCYLIIGVADNGDIIGLNKNSPNRKNQAAVLDLLSNSMFAGDFVPEVSVETILIGSKEIDVLTVFNSYNVPFYLRSKSRKYHSIVEGYIYSRKNDRNTPISENSSMQQIELLWKKRLGLLSPPLEQIISRMRNKAEWQEIGDIYYNVFNPDFKIKEEWDQEEHRDYKREFYSYNQCNESTHYINLYILCRETVLKQFQVVILDSGRYKTPVPTWGFIHDPIRYSESIYTYKYILKNSIDYAIQQFIYNEDSDEARIAKQRFDEVVLYFENEQEQVDFHLSIESCPAIVEKYINDAKLGKYIVSSNNKLEIKDCTEKLITAFAFKRYLSDYRRKKSGVDVKRIKSIRIVNRTSVALRLSDIVEHRVDINETGKVKHFLYNRESKKAVSTYNYCADKYWTRNFLNFIEPITTDWERDYSVDVSDGYEWYCTLKYDDGTTKNIKGNIVPPPFADDIERRIINLAAFEVTPWLFNML